jgi:hypothetical protein
MGQCAEPIFFYTFPGFKTWVVQALDSTVCIHTLFLALLSLLWIWQAFENRCVLLHYGNLFCAMAHSEHPNAVPRLITYKQIHRYGP